MSYIADFGKQLIKKNNIGVAIYLLLNLLLIISIFNNSLMGVTAYGISLIVALSPLGEWILRKQQGCKPILRKEDKERMEPLFKEVLNKAKTMGAQLPDDLQLFISNDPSMNAFATGRKTICITRGLLRLSDEEIKGVLSHEMGHLSNKDTDLILVISVGNMIVTALFFMLRLLFTGTGFIVSIINNSIGSLFITFLMDVALVGMIWVWTKFGILLVMHSSRKNEYLADEFAKDSGYGDALIQALDNMSYHNNFGKKGLWANLAASHPDLDLRVAKIQGVA